MENIVRHTYNITQVERNRLNGHESFAVWFTGLSGSGKSTIANQLEKVLHRSKVHTYSLDGDNIRSGLNNDLGFSEGDRHENIRRIAEVTKLFVDAGVVAISAFISPTKTDRALAKEIIGEDRFIEVFVNTPLEVCEARDVKGLYKKARAGEIKDFTGISAPYEPPETADIEIRTEEEPLEDSVQKIVSFLNKKLMK